MEAADVLTVAEVVPESLGVEAGSGNGWVSGL
jgi:hypothetical protein